MLPLHAQVLWRASRALFGSPDGHKRVLLTGTYLALEAVDAADASAVD